MARKIIILDRRQDDNDVSVAFWLDVPLARQSLIARADATSVVADITGTELTDLRAGKFVERVERRQYPSSLTLAQILSRLVDRYNELQADVTGDNRYRWYGSFWDGTGWTQKGSS